MLDLANRFWDWRVVKLEVKRIENEEKERVKLIRKKYGYYMDKAKGVSSNKSADLNLDKAFEECIESGVVGVELTEHYCTASFSNGWTVKFWIANEMYGYCSQDTTFQKPDGEKLVFSHTMPSMYMCYYVRDKVEHFQPQK